MPDRRPSMAEVDFIDNFTASLDGMCPYCRATLTTALLRYFGDTLPDALSAVFELSRTALVLNILAGRPAHNTDSTYILSLFWSPPSVLGAEPPIPAHTSPAQIARVS